MNQILTIQQVEKNAELARIELTSEEKQKFSRELAAILDYVAKLNEIDTEKVKPTSQITDLYNIMRGDKILANQKRDKILAQAPAVQAGGIKVKAVF